MTTPAKVLGWSAAGAVWGPLVLVMVGLFLVGGKSSTRSVDVPSAAAARYDHRSKAWTTAPPLLVKRTNHAAAVLSDGSVLVVGGEEEDRSKVDPVPSRSSEIWRPDRPHGSRAGALPAGARNAALLALPGARAIVVGGVDVSAPLLASPGASAWTTGAPYGQVLWLGFAAALAPDGKVLLVYGDAETWDPATEAWTHVAAPPFGVSAAELVPLADGRMLLVGEGGPNINTYRYEPATQFQVWTPSTGTWQVLGAWPGTGHVHRTAQLTSGEVLVLRDGRTGTSEATLWSPASPAPPASPATPAARATGELTPIDPPANYVEHSTLTPLPDGAALYVGAPAPQLWSAADHRWTPLAAPPGSPLRNHVAVRLLGGDVLIAGGDAAEMHSERFSLSMAGGGAFGLLVLLAGAVAAVRRFAAPVWALLGAIACACAAGGVGVGFVMMMSAIARID